MLIKIYCTNIDCGASYSVDGDTIGRVPRCKKCGSRIPMAHQGPPQEDPMALSKTDADSTPGVPNPSIPASFGRYKVVSLLGRGGMGSVYLATDSQLKRQVALKVPHIVAFSHRPDVRTRFFREAEAAARFQHPNFCPIFDIGEENGTPYLAMAYIEGKTLSAMIDKGVGWPSKRSVEVVHELAAALAELHREGIVHRDLKPANVMVDSRGRLVLLDFGLARWYDDLDISLTPDGAVIGTPAYMPPEQAEGKLKAIGPRSDLYSLGVILYQLLTGRCPFEGPAAKVLGMVTYAEPPPFSKFRRDLDPRLESICLKAMAKKLEDRYVSMDEFARILKAWLDQDQAPKPVVGNHPTPGPKGVNPAPPTPNSGPLASFTNTIGMTFHPIRAGDFAMGSPDTDKQAPESERPRHKVRITQPFYLGSTPVTVRQFRAFVKESRYKTEAERRSGGIGWDDVKATFIQDPRYTWRSPGFAQTLDHPVVNVSWNDAVEFCTWLGTKENQAYRLPTEAEWEYACRAGTTTQYWFGDDPALLASMGNVVDGSPLRKFPNAELMNKGKFLNFPKWSADEITFWVRLWKRITARDRRSFTTPVGRFPANPWDLHDMHGNVWEWCADLYSPNYADAPKSIAIDPKGPAQNSNRHVVRGGDWCSFSRDARSASRMGPPTSFMSNYLGFRVARNA